MGKGFKDVHVSFIGSHECGDKIPQWMKAHGGSFSREMNEKVTHLIASETAIKKNVHAVQQARDSNTNLVTYDWLEDSLLAKPPRPLKVGPYLWDRTQKSKSEKAEKGKGNPGRNPRQKSAPKQEVEADAGAAFRKLISVYESHDEPKAYMTSVKYSRARVSRKDILAPHGSTLDFALFTFEKFFKMKTGLEWKDRFDGSKIPTADTVDDGGPTNPEGGWFMFERPGGIMGSLNIDAERKLSIE